MHKNFFDGVLANEFVNHILLAPVIQSHFIKDAHDRLLIDSQNLSYNLGLLENSDNGAIVCYQEPDKCVDTAKRLIGTDGKSGELSPVDGDIINAFNVAYALTDPDGHIDLAVPIGIDEYLWYYPDDLSIRSIGSLKVINGGQDIVTDGTDANGYHFNGKFHKVNEGVYSGTVTIGDHTFNQTFYQTDSPL